MIETVLTRKKLYYYLFGVYPFFGPNLTILVIEFRIYVLPCEDIEMNLHVRNDEERVNSTKEKGSSLLQRG